MCNSNLLESICNKNVIFSESYGQHTDICGNLEVEIIPLNAIRIYAYETPPGEKPLCDRNIINETKWYKAANDMVTNATKPDICGTTYPIWLQGKQITSEN